MKLKVGDKVLVTAGKDKGKKSVVTALLIRENKVVVKDVNLYFKHIKPFMDRPGEKVRRERALPVSNVAILNEKDQADRVAYRITAGKKERIFRKTGTVIAEQKLEKAIKETKKAKKTDKKAESKVSLKEVAKAEQKAAKKKQGSSARISRIRKTQDKG